MKALRSLLLLLLVPVLFLFACSSKPEVDRENQVKGALWIGENGGGSTFDVLAYPLTEDELVLFEESFPALEAAAKRHGDLWAEVFSAEDPAVAAEQGEFWDEAGLLGSDILAVSLKLTFLAEFATAEEGMEDDMRQNLAWLEERLKGEDAKPELFETADSIRMILGVISIQRESGAFDYYEENKARIDAALDRFTSIGEQ